MRNIREFDEREHTVIMMQVENEVGLIGSSRDHNPMAEEEFTKPVSEELIEYLKDNEKSLNPYLRCIWEKSGPGLLGIGEKYLVLVLMRFLWHGTLPAM